VIKKIKNNNDDGANTKKKQSDFSITVTVNNPSPSSFPGSSSGTPVKLRSGTYKVTETGPSGYTSSLSSDCSGRIDADQTRECSIKNEAKNRLRRNL
jgi:hypothetical protein